MFTKLFSKFANYLIVSKIKKAIKGVKVEMGTTKIIIPITVKGLPDGVLFGQVQFWINKAVDEKLEPKFKGIFDFEVEIKRADGI